MEHINPIILGAIFVQMVIANVSRLMGAIVGYLITAGILVWGLSLYQVGNAIAFFGISLSKSVFLLGCLIWFAFDTKEFVSAYQESEQSISIDPNSEQKDIPIKP